MATYRGAALCRFPGPGHSSQRRRRGARLSARSVALLALVFLVAATAAAATDDLPPEVPRPDFMRNRPFIPDQLLREKPEGRYVTGIPAIGWDAEEGANVGAFFEFYDNGSRDDPFFRTAPYRRVLLVGGTVTTQETLRALARLDMPYINDSPYRLRIDALFERNRQVHYFGVGEDSLDLVSPWSGETFREFDHYQDNLDTRFGPGPVPGGFECPATEPACSFSRSYQYEAKDFFLVTSIERDMVGGLVRPLIGFQIRHIDIDDYTGDHEDAPRGGKYAFQLPTRLFQDCEAGVVVGCDGGWDNHIKLGLIYDSRDFEPNPTRGVLAQVVGALSSKAFGSKGTYQRVTVSAAGFYDLLEGHDTDQNLILAARGVYNMQFGTVPVFVLPQFSFSENDRFGLGAFSSLRGYKRRRFVGKSAVSLHAEVRWFFMEGRFLGQHLRPGLAGFADTGRSFTDVDLRVENWRVGAGAGFRLAWNLNTLISFDFGVSKEDSVFYMELGTTF
jgi:hypothetical protein